MKIFGAGIAGLMAGCMFQDARIYEAKKEGDINHKALLRFRSPAVGEFLGIDFKEVRVHKGIWCDGKFIEPNIRVANQYSNKVIDKLVSRSIWNTDTVTRYIAPETFIEQLVERCATRINWEHRIRINQEDFFRLSEPTISTIPLSSFAFAFKKDDSVPIFRNRVIYVKRYRIKDCNVHQTIYYPSPELGVYRASITGDLLIVESVCEPSIDDFTQVYESFGFHSALQIKEIKTESQQFGKIDEIDDAWRKAFIFELSHEHQIYSLGRFGTWRNILLDDVLKDLNVIKRLMNTSSYEQRKKSTK